MKIDPKKSDADKDGYVLAWDIDTQSWVKRLWFDFSSHPEWSEEDRKEIQRRYPTWKPIDSKQRN